MTRKAEARDRILRATIDTLAAQGFPATTARAIATTGGFTPGVIYYHFDDLDDLFLAAMRHSSDLRMARYTERTDHLDRAQEMLRTLRELYEEDISTGHIAAVQQLVAGAARSSGLALGVRAEIDRWEEFTGSLIGRFLDGTPLAAFIPKQEVAMTVLAFYLGLEMLAHLDGDRSRGAAIFDSAKRMASMIDAFLPADPA
ncbi:TetR/AcrR family transcriptional regulator [Umezawaea tangerina]|uniref:TetR family transcriptional regulator n=1 Tax=Umezawaea tangerina TaxID=84725 RepID=A0A2T0TFQ0_9PSEU|nr:TetR/AcrR family transcriptional regulator [Umezawaea tangerina]PRY44471.1 TetR family transcriptional regulator [Umezawaea tangerina]